MSASSFWVFADDDGRMNVKIISSLMSQGCSEVPPGHLPVLGTDWLGGERKCSIVRILVQYSDVEYYVLVQSES